MPSPFHGMDPYLEGPEWRSVHWHLANEIARYLSDRLPDNYIARAEKVYLLSDPEPLMTVEVLDLSDRSLVTAIEILSATNKVGDGRAEYLAKRRRMLASDSHLIELDLLRSGRRVPMAAPLPDAPYFALVSRVERRPIAEVWPIPLRQKLPTIPVPLRPGDADVPLELQLVLTTLYDVFRYGRELDYTRPPAVPLSPEDAAWAEELLGR
jgi:hypothetical protein